MSSDDQQADVPCSRQYQGMLTFIFLHSSNSTKLAAKFAEEILQSWTPIMTLIICIPSLSSQARWQRGLTVGDPEGEASSGNEKTRSHRVSRESGTKQAPDFPATEKKISAAWLPLACDECAVTALAQWREQECVDFQREQHGFCGFVDFVDFSGFR